MSADARATDAAIHRLRLENATLRAERDRLREALVEAVATADAWIGACCGVAVGQRFCEQFGCASVATLVRPLRAALDVGANEGAMIALRLNMQAKLRLRAKRTRTARRMRDLRGRLESVSAALDDLAVDYDAANQRDALRAVLAPLLDELATAGFDCPFCDGVVGPDYDHAPDCPVLRRDELLGRADG